MKSAILPAVIPLAVFPSARAQQRDDGKLTIDIPAAVQATIQKENGNGKLIRKYHTGGTDE